MAKYKLLHGRHQGPGVRNQPSTYEKGDVVESKEPLHELFANKFKKVKDGTPVTCANPGEDLKGKVPKADKGDVDETKADYDDNNLAEKPATGELGVEVTDAFAGAKESNMLVFKDGKKYNVTEAAFPTVAINEEPLTKTQVIKLIHDNMPAESDDD